MNIAVTIATVDRTNYINWESFNIENILNSQVDTCSFELIMKPSAIFTLAAGDEIAVIDDATTIFAGVITQLEKRVEGLVIKYRITAKDWTTYLDRILVAEKYESMTVDAIIADIAANYLSGFTLVNVNCPTVITSITFNRLPVSKCLDLLAEQLNYCWYPDYAKDIHFFAKNSEAAPYGLTDDNGNYVFSSLVITDDLTQMRNRVFIRGGEMVGNSVPENFTGDSTKKTFALGHKFSSLPTVTVGGAAKTVGVDFLDADTSFDCLWNFNEKYIRFVSAPGASAIVVTGTPLIPIIVQVQDDASIVKFGVYEFAKTDKTIATKEEAKQYAISQLEAYADKISAGSFETYVSGLRSGQIINIQSTIRGLNENYLIQRVALNMRGPNDGIWKVELATLRTMGIIAFLQRLLIDQNKLIVVADNEVLEKYYVDNQNIQVTELISLHTELEDHQSIQVTELLTKDPYGVDTAPDFVLAPYTPGSEVAANIADSYAETNQNASYGFNSSTMRPGQSFNGNGRPLSRAKLYLLKGGTPTGNIVAKLYAHTGSYGAGGKPTGAALAVSDPVAVSSLGGSYGLISFNFSTPYTLVNGTKYCITLESAGDLSVNGANYIFVGYDNSSPTHGGNLVDWNGAVWTGYSGLDSCFYIYTDLNDVTDPKREGLLDNSFYVY